MNANFDPTERVITATEWTRDRIIAEQLIENYRLVRQERVTVRKIALVFKKIEFMPPVENQKMRERFKEVAKELDK